MCVVNARQARRNLLQRLRRGPRRVIIARLRAPYPGNPFGIGRDQARVLRYKFTTRVNAHTRTLARKV